jgi:DNA-binding PucR family transcriptional regulator
VRFTAETGASLLAVAAEATTEWVWLGYPAGRVDVAGRLIELAASRDVTIGVGILEQGPDGFRETHRQAQTAKAIGGRLDRRAVAYTEVALEDLAAQNTARAHAFTGRELGPLTADTREAERLRRTLQAYFACAQRASSAAAMLGVHERTISNRLRRVEELLGHSPSDRRAELELALRLRALPASPNERT